MPFWSLGFASTNDASAPAGRAAVKPGGAGDPANPQPDDEDDDEAGVGRDVNETLQKLMPWAISLIGHAVVIVLALLLVFALQRELPEEKRPVVPSIALDDNVGSPVTADLTTEIQADSSQFSVVTNPVTATNPSPFEMQAMSGVVSVTSAGGSPLGDMGTGQGSGDFMGVPGGNAQRIVFVIDASGSIVGEYPFVIEELTKSIQKLGRGQQFQVVFFTGQVAQPVYALGNTSRQLLDAQRYKTDVLQWVATDAHNVELGGQGDPIAAMRAAIDMRPEVVFLLSDNIIGTGRYERQQRELLREVYQYRRDRSPETKICTIQFLYPDTLAPANALDQWTLSIMAQGDPNRRNDDVNDFWDGNGGTFKFVDERELQRLRLD